MYAALRVDDVVLIRNCPPISKQKKFTLERVIKSPEEELETRRAQEAQLALESGEAVPLWTTSPSTARPKVSRRHLPLCGPRAYIIIGPRALDNGRASGHAVQATTLD